VLAVPPGAVAQAQQRPAEAAAAHS
jgi:hypothetical protein